MAAGAQVDRRWRELAERLFAKYNDGYVQDASGQPQEVGYPDAWLRDVVTLRPDQFRLPPDGSATSPAAY